jgi:hypothetical protein
MPYKPPDYAYPLADLRRSLPWVVVWCEGRVPGGYPCNHHAPFAVVPYIIRYGPTAPTYRWLKALRCSKCGHKGASLQYPSFGRVGDGFPPFPRGREMR